MIKLINYTLQGPLTTSSVRVVVMKKLCIAL